MTHLTMAQLEAGLDHIKQSPKDFGVLEMICRRPRVNEREVLELGELHTVDGLIGDSWNQRESSRTPDRLPNPETQLNIINSRAIALIAQTKERWALAGDQLFLDLDLSIQNLPPGTRVQLGTAVIEVTPPPHTGCKKFVARFGLDAMMFVNSANGRQLCLRGINAKVIKGGIVRVGDQAHKII